MQKTATTSVRSQFQPATGAVAYVQPDVCEGNKVTLDAKGNGYEIGSLLTLPGLEYLTLKTDAALSKEDYGEALFAIVRDGIVGLQHVLDDGRRSISHLFLPGDIIDFRYGKKVPGKAVCLFPSELALVNAEALTSLENDETRVDDMLGSSLLKHWELATRHCSDLARKSAIEKLASYIFEFRTRYPLKNGSKNKGAVHLALRRVDISDYLGLRPETLCRAFAKLKQGNIIEFNDVGYVKILDEIALRKIADGRL